MRQDLIQVAVCLWFLSLPWVHSQKENKVERNKRENMQPGKERNTDAVEAETETTSQNKPSVASGSDLNMAVTSHLTWCLEKAYLSLSLYLYIFFGYIRTRTVERTWSLKWNR